MTYAEEGLHTFLFLLSDYFLPPPSPEAVLHLRPDLLVVRVVIQVDGLQRVLVMVVELSPVTLVLPVRGVADCVVPIICHEHVLSVAPLLCPDVVPHVVAGGVPLVRNKQS